MKQNQKYVTECCEAEFTHNDIEGQDECSRCGMCPINYKLIEQVRVV